MYHIKPDKRSRTSAEAIVNGMQECLKTAPLNSITVSDIHRVTGISRATFYRLFDTPEDVLRYHFDQMIAASVENASPDRQYTSRELLERTITLGMEHHAFLKALVDNGRLDLLFRYTEKSFRMPEVEDSLFSSGTDPMEREYILNQLSMSMVATLITWAKNGRQETAAQVVQYLKKYVRVVSTLIAEDP